METVAPASELEKKLFRRGDSVILDFGEHRTGYLSFRLIGEGVHVDAPTRLRLILGHFLMGAPDQGSIGRNVQWTVPCC